MSIWDEAVKKKIIKRVTKRAILCREDASYEDEERAKTEKKEAREKIRDIAI